MKNKFLLIASILTCTFLLSSCTGSMEKAKMNSYAHEFNHDEVKEMAKDYAEDKYGDSVQVGDVISFTDTIYDYDYKQQDVLALYDLLASLSEQIMIIAYTPEYYAEFKPHFNDSEYMTANHYMRRQYCTAKAGTYEARERIKEDENN